MKKQIFTIMAAAAVLASCSNVKPVSVNIIGCTTRTACQLWENGPYWADRNIGAAESTAFGRYFQFGDTEGKVPGSYDTFSPAFSTVAIDIGDVTQIPLHFDSAAANWGVIWCMPTKTDLENLLTKCDKEQITGGTKGNRFTGKGDYAGNSIFLPTPGYGWAQWYKDIGKYGSIWSSTVAPPDKYGNLQAWRLALDQEGSTLGVIDDDGRPCGHTVRAVLR